MIVVTGGAGFIGSAFVWKLNSEGIDDIIVVDELDTSEKWKNLVNRRYADYLHKDDFLKMVLAEKLPFNVRALIHMGACSSTTEQDAGYLMENNYRYTCRLAGIKKYSFSPKIITEGRCFPHSLQCFVIIPPDTRPV